jgi:hypothetical protein
MPAVLVAAGERRMSMINDQGFIHLHTADPLLKPIEVDTRFHAFLQMNFPG